MHLLNCYLGIRNHPFLNQSKILQFIFGIYKYFVKKHLLNAEPDLTRQWQPSAIGTKYLLYCDVSEVNLTQFFAEQITSVLIIATELEKLIS